MLSDDTHESRQKLYGRRTCNTSRTTDLIAYLCRQDETQAVSDLSLAREIARLADIDYISIADSWMHSKLRRSTNFPYPEATLGYQNTIAFPAWLQGVFLMSRLRRFKEI